MNIFGNQMNPDDFIYKPAKYLRDFVLTASQILTSQSVTLTGDEDFFCVLRLMSTQTGAWRSQIYVTASDRLNANGLNTGNDRCRNACQWGDASRPYVLPVAIIVPAKSAILLDLEDISVAGNTLHLVFDGLKAYRRR